jgi:protein-tyrosine-phosphatase
MINILIVGSKNTYRSIIAAEYLKKMLVEKGKNTVEVLGGGIMAFADIPAEPEAAEQLKALGIQGDFRSRALDKKSVMDAGLILTMSGKIKAAILAKFPDMKDKVHTFKGYFEDGADLDLAASPALAGEIAMITGNGFEKIMSL